MFGRVAERPNATDCKSVVLRLRWFESIPFHQTIRLIKMENVKDKILLFIPMYNCEKQILRVLSKLNNDIFSYIDEVLIVDNGSTDNGVCVVKDYIQNHKYPKMTLVQNHENYSLGGSHKVAIKYAQENFYDFLIVLHGDDQGNIYDLLPYLESGEYRDFDCLLGSRFMKGSCLKNYSKFRIFGNKVFNIIYSICAGKKITDLGAGLNMYRVSIFEQDYYIKCSDSLVFNYEMILKSIYLKHKIKFFPIKWTESDQRSNVKMLRQSFATLKIALIYFFNKKKFFIKDNRLNKNLTYKYTVLQSNFNKTEVQY